MRRVYPLLTLVIFLLASCEKQEHRSVRIDVKELVGIKGCPYCHDMRRKLLGPSFYDISRRYYPKDREQLIDSILKGSSGRWGDRSMPPQKLSREEAELIVDWILNLKNDLN